MKANELMIGDWVIVYEKAMPVKAKVEGVHGNLATVLGHARIVDNGGNTPYVLPIHLNSDILEKNGFEWRAGGVIIAGEDLALVQCGDEWEVKPNQMSDDTVCYIEYVHELQHALKLCGIEKTIEL